MNGINIERLTFRIVEFLFADLENFSMVFEYMPLGALQNYIPKQRFMGWRDRYQLFLDICIGIAYLHSPTDQDGNPKTRMVHSELTSGNVFVSKEGGVMRAKIADFGLAPMKSYAVEIGAASVAKGYRDTTCYVAPERLLTGAGSKYTVKCDIFSMGVILLELVSLRAPEHLRKVLPKIREMKMPPGLRKCIDMCLVYCSRKITFRLMLQEIGPIFPTSWNS
jgi:serine/threonine protein kinase